MTNDINLLQLNASISKPLLLVDIPFGTNQEEDKIQSTQNRQQPIEVVELALVKVVGDPWVCVPSDMLHYGHQQGANEEPKSYCAQKQSCAHCLHSFGALPQKEVQLTNVNEGLA